MVAYIVANRPRKTLNTSREMWLNFYWLIKALALSSRAKKIPTLGSKYYKIYTEHNHKGTVSQDFLYFICIKLYLGPIWTGKNVSSKFFVFAKIFTKNVCPRCRWLRRHLVNYFTFENEKKLTIEVCNKKFNLIFLKIVCWRSRWLRGHGVSVS